MTDRDQRASDHLVRLVQVVFGVVIAQSLILYREVVVSPHEHWVAALGLGIVYVTTVLSWIDWHITMEARPYNFNPRNRHRPTEQLRLGCDLIVVTLYAYLLLSLSPMVGAPDGSIAPHILGYPAVFVAYYFSGLARQVAHGKLASSPGPIVIFGLLYVGLYIAYRGIFTEIQMKLGPDLRFLNGLVLGFALALMVLYRITRRRLRDRRAGRKNRGLSIGMDVDGVLANQIEGLIPKIRARHGVELGYNDVTEWRLPIRDSDIAKEIEAAQMDPDYLVGMPLHDGARDVVDELYDEHRIVITTARPPETRGWTIQWLQNHGFSYDEVVNLREEKKSLFATDLLIDDYIGNVKDYLSNTSGHAILVDQPWNRDRSDLDPWARNGRLQVVMGIRDVPRTIRDMRQRSSARNASIATQA